LPRGAAAAQDAPHGPERHLHGIVEDSASGRPLGGIELLITVLGDAAPRFRTRSDNNGRFDFRALPASSVVVRSRALGFHPAERRVDLTSADQLITIHLVPATTRLEEVTVRADSVAEQLAGVMSVSTIDAQNLAASRGQTLGDAIRNLPGVAIIQFGPSIAKPVIRGLNSQRVLVMNGGLRQEDQQWGTEHAPNIDSFDASTVTVVRGAATVLYGPDALGGVVRVDPAAVPDSGRLRGTIAVNAFSNSRQGATSAMVQGADLSLPLVGRTGYRVRVTTRAAGNGQAPDYFLSNTGFREVNGSAAVGVTRAFGTSELTFSRFSTELGVLRQAHVGNADDLARAMTTAPLDSAFSYTIGRPNQRVAHTMLRSRTEFRLPGEQSLEVVYGFQYNHRREYDNHGPLRFRDEPAFHLKLFTNALDVRYRHARWQAMRGTVGSSLTVQGNQTLGKAFLIPGYDMVQGALYAQEALSLGPIEFSASARADAMSQTTLPYADLGIRSPAGTRRWQNASGSFGANWSVRDNLQLTARVARAWRPPTVNERYAQGVHHGTAQYELGDAALAEEVSFGVETSLRYQSSRLQLDLAAYRNTIDGFIFLRPTQPVFTLRGTFPGYRYTQTDARLAGVELASAVTIGDGWSATWSGTVVRGRDRRLDAPLFDMPADRASLGVRREGASPRWGHWSFDVRGQFVRQQDQVPTGTVYTLPTAGYALVQSDVRSDGLSLFGHPMDVSLSVINALDTRYRDYLSRYRLFVNDTGRDVVVRLSVPF
jgi:iron complex outermembrane receptor protein